MANYHMEFLNQRIEDYLVWSIGYYQNDVSYASNNMYDTCCLILRDHYTRLPDWFKEIVSLEDLKAGTGFTVKAHTILDNDVRLQVCYRLRTDDEWTHGE